MAGGIRIKMNRAGAKAILQSEEVREELVRRGELAAQAAGGAPDFIVLSTIGTARARASVITATEEGRRAEATDRVLANALDAARG